MSKKKQDKKEKGGLGRFVVLLLVFVAVAGAAFWYLAPDEFQDQDACYSNRRASCINIR